MSVLGLSGLRCRSNAIIATPSVPATFDPDVPATGVCKVPATILAIRLY